VSNTSGASVGATGRSSLAVGAARGVQPQPRDDIAVVALQALAPE